jgi:hypothetical protein
MIRALTLNGRVRVPPPDWVQGQSKKANRGSRVHVPGLIVHDLRRSAIRNLVRTAGEECDGDQLSQNGIGL